MNTKLEGKRVAILATDGFEQSELVDPKKILEGEGVECVVVSPKEGSIKGWKDKDWGDEVKVDLLLKDAKAETFDALVLPGGQMNPDMLRGLPEVQAFVRAFAEAGKPIGAICHGPWSLIDAGIVKGRTVTSWPSIQTDLVNAGAKWVDKEVVVDMGLVTSRKPDDIPAFTRKVIEEMLEPSHANRGKNANGVPASQPGL
ncbi:MAG: type 1 glutamine amidotransferase [Labilithrix sp.]|nr:type 1 glutamine amidotransferase [Labilithrix sp.]MCW5809559.1 type 1 glutamine amidotransferase [Labilithrix sp.]